MSNYVAPAFHPKTGLIVDATWLDNHFGPRIYGVSFDGDDKVYKSIECAMEAAGAEIERLRVIETAARRFVQEAEDYPRYAPVKVWATPEADPYLKLRVALGDQQFSCDAAQQEKP